MSRFLKKIVPFFVMVAIALAGCGEISSSDTPAVPPPGGGDDNNIVIEVPTDVVQGTTLVQTVQGTLVDLGDLVASDTNTWWYTRAVGINDNGLIIGQSNQGDVVKGAFVWDPSNEQIRFLGIHLGLYDDFYSLKENNTSENFFRYSEAVSINSSGKVIGNSTTGTGWPNETEKRAFLYDHQAGTIVDLPPPAYLNQNGELVIASYSEAVQINNKGEVIITADGRDGKQAYYWDSTSTVTHEFEIEGGGIRQVVSPAYILLGRILGQDSEAVAINEMGQAVVNSGSTAVFHDLNDGAIESLNHLPGATQTRAVAINDSGNVVGVSGNLGFFWRGGAMYPIGHIGGGSSEAVAINSSNQVAGNSTLPGGASRAIVWSIVNGRGQIMNLGTLGGANSYATGINEAGQVVGYSETGTTYTEGSISVNEVRAFLWSNGVMYDLGVHDDFYNYPFVKPFPFSEGVAINNNGEIAGNSHSINSHFRGFYLQPTLP